MKDIAFATIALRQADQSAYSYTDPHGFLPVRPLRYSLLAPEIGRLTSLIWLDLSGNHLAQLPAELLSLTSLQGLRLAGNQLTTLPRAIERLTSLMWLDLSGNQLAVLPLEICRLSSLQGLYLSANRLTKLPPEIDRLTKLRELDISSNEYMLLPPEIGRLTALEGLYLSGNALSELPREIGRLTSLEELDVSRNRLSQLPPEIGRLTSLRELDASSNRFTHLPPEIGRLASLHDFKCHRNQIAELPQTISRLAHLKRLDLSVNQLASLPPELDQLTNLEELDASSNELTQLSPEFGRLGNLQVLNLSDNKLPDLPSTLSQLSGTLSLRLKGNPLREPLPTLVDRGTQELFVYLRSLEGGEPQFEAKVILVGEGNVGKTSLVAALGGEPFVENRLTTHGIAVGPLKVKHPRLEVMLTLNTWDFAGQEIYRITHQFFFTPRALYLLVWRPREGQEENAIEGWCKRIRMRIGNDARILIVATHCEERSAELDFPELRRKFGEILIGHHAVDNRSGTGIAALLRTISEAAASLPQMGERMNTSWAAVRDQLLARPEASIAHRDFVGMCNERGLASQDIQALSVLLTDLGHIIYYGEDEGLRDILVLRPEWLTKAIGYVLEDIPTRHAGGVLDHHRLREIWASRQDGESYPVEHYPYFIRLMEKFDISYRLPDEEHKSLVTQLVPYERPEDLPWDIPDEGSERRPLSLICRMGDEAPGLVAWLTVRNHRFSVGLHWRRGVFLVHEAYHSQALIELKGDRDLLLTVKAPSPGYFFSILRDSIENLMTLRWGGLTRDFLIPCPTVLHDGTPCAGQFKFLTLWRRREARGLQTADCWECDEQFNVAELLTGFPTLSLPLDERLDRMKEELEEQLHGIAVTVQGALEYAADSAKEVRAVLKVVSEEVPDCPALFTLTPREGTWRPAALWQSHYRITLWCEHHEAQHPCPDARYDISRPKDWLKRVAPYARFVTKTLQLIVPIAGAVAGQVWNEEDLKGAKQEIELMKTLVGSLPDDLDMGTAVEPTAGLTRTQGAGLRAFRALLLEKDQSKIFGGLQRVVTASGDFLWICPTHYIHYDPGLPALPSQA